MPDKTQESVNFSPLPAKVGVPFLPQDGSANEDELARRELARITPSNEKLLELAKKYPPPLEYFEGEEDMPFDPIEE